MRHSLIGHAIISADGFIADASGAMPKPLMIEADWLRFQAELDASTVTLLGRLGHEAHPNARQRRRLVVSTGVAGLRLGSDGPGRIDVFNPQDIGLQAVLDHLFPESLWPSGARIGVVGGTRVFDLVLSQTGFTRFDLVTAQRVRLGAGRPCFSVQDNAFLPADVLRRAGYGISKADWLDQSQRVLLEAFSPPLLHNDLSNPRDAAAKDAPA